MGSRDYLRRFGGEQKVCFLSEKENASRVRSIVESSLNARVVGFPFKRQL